MCVISFPRSWFEERRDFTVIFCKLDRISSLLTLVGMVILGEIYLKTVLFPIYLVVFVFAYIITGRTSWHML